MASKKKESESIALLSMYGDEDDDDMEQDASDNEAVAVENKEQSGVGASEAADMEEDGIADADKSCGYGISIDSRTPVSKDRLTSQQVISAEPSRGRKETLTIVDYGHDEAALSPEAEEGEIAATGRVMFGAELQTVNEAAAPEEAVNIAEDGEKEMDPLDKFLPPPPMTKCTDKLQEKIINFLKKKKEIGRRFNSDVRNKKGYRNPDFLLHAVTYQDIDQIRSCFSKDVFDPHGYDKSDYYDEIEADMKRELERKEQEKKKNQKIYFLFGGTQSVAFPTPKIVPIPAAVDTGTSTWEGRPNKKFKWDKVDGDRRLPLTTSSQFSVSKQHF